MRRQLLAAFAATLLSPGIASAASSITRIDLCLGDTHVVEARDGHAFTYTEPKYAAAWPSMAKEAQASQGALDEWAASGDPMPVGWWLSPNRELLEGAGAVTTDSKDQAWANPALYVSELSSSRSQLVLHGHAVGAHKLQVWQRDNATGSVKKLSYAIFVAQCGTSTLLPSSGDDILCEGAALVPDAADAPRTSLNPRVLYTFNGADSGALVYAGVRSGWATVADLEARNVEDSSQRVEVIREGVQGCPVAAAANLSPVSGPNTFALNMCKNHSWVMPTKQRVAGITVSNGNLWHETGVGDDGVLLYAMSQGKTTVVVDFKDDKAEPMILDVTVSPCN